MGLEVAKQLAAKGAHIAIIARDQGKLELARAEVEAQVVEPGVQKVRWFSADLTSAGEVERVFGEVVAWGGVPDVVWTCAGESGIPTYRWKQGMLIRRST